MNEHCEHHSSFMDYKLKRRKWINLDKLGGPENPTSPEKMTAGNPEPKESDKHEILISVCDVSECNDKSGTPESNKSDEDSGIQSDAGSWMSASKSILSNLANNSQSVSPNGSNTSEDAEQLMKEHGLRMDKAAFQSWKNVQDSIHDIEQERKKNLAVQMTGFGDRLFRLPHAVVHTPKEMENREDMPLMQVPINSSMGRMFVNFPVLMNHQGNMASKRSSQQQSKKCDDDTTACLDNGITQITMTTASNTAPTDSRGSGKREVLQQGASHPMDAHFSHVEGQVSKEATDITSLPNIKFGWKDNPLVNGFGFDGMNMMYGRHPCSSSLMNPFAGNNNVASNNKQTTGEEDNRGLHEEHMSKTSNVTNWEYLDKVHQSQKEEMNLKKQEQEEEKQGEDEPMNCDICGDRATGLHYGIVSCEGCKGFFKRTVQNRRVYTCVNEGTCEVTKSQRNRCQFCRFKKCLEKGMIMAAVREDRMPGGRNSGAVYKLYKVRYRKHRQKMKYRGSGSTSNSSVSSQDDNLSVYSSNSGSQSGTDGFNTEWSTSPVSMQVQGPGEEDSSDGIQEKRMAMQQPENDNSVTFQQKEGSCLSQYVNTNYGHAMTDASVPAADQFKGYPLIFGDLNPRSFVEVAGRKLRFGCNKMFEKATPAACDRFDSMSTASKVPEDSLVTTEPSVNPFFIARLTHQNGMISSPFSQSSLTSSSFVPHPSHGSMSQGIATLPSGSIQVNYPTQDRHTALKYATAPQIKPTDLSGNFAANSQSRKVLPVPSPSVFPGQPTSYIPHLSTVNNSASYNNPTMAQSQISYGLVSASQTVYKNPIALHGPDMAVTKAYSEVAAARPHLSVTDKHALHVINPRKVPHSSSASTHNPQGVFQRHKLCPPAFVARDSQPHSFQVRYSDRMTSAENKGNDLTGVIYVKSSKASLKCATTVDGNHAGGAGATETLRHNIETINTVPARSPGSTITASPQSGGNSTSKHSDTTAGAATATSGGADGAAAFDRGGRSVVEEESAHASSDSHDSTTSQQQKIVVSEGEPLIEQLLSREDFQGGILRQQLPISKCEDISEILSQIGDEVVCQLVPWMKNLPFYSHMSLAMSTQILLKHWDEVLLLASCTSQAWQLADKKPCLDTQQQFVFNLQKVHSYLTHSLCHIIRFDNLFSEIGEIVEKVTKLVYAFKDMKITQEEFVCMKVMLILSEGDSVSEKLHGCYRASLERFTQQKWPGEGSRLAELEEKIHDIRSTADDLLLKKMFYVPLVLNTFP